MNTKTTLLREIESGRLALLTDGQIAKKLHLYGKEAAALRKMLLSLVKEGSLLMDSSARFGTVAQFHALEGTISASGHGYAFFYPDDGSERLFLPRRVLGGACHGDRVLAFPTGYGDAGEVLKVLSRGITEVVGVYHREGRRGYLRPDEWRFASDIYIPDASSMRCTSGMKAAARITSYEGELTGEIVAVFGESGILSVEEEAIIRAHSLRTEFPAEVLRAADKAASRPITEEDLMERADLREELIVTVDGEDTRDIDDAISVRKMGTRFELGVHIADVSHYVPRNRTVDKEAFLRGTSIYFPDRVLPMLPPSLSNGACSLNEGEDRLTLSCLMTIDERGEVLARSVRPSVIRSRHRMTYTAVQALFDGEEGAQAEYPDLLGFMRDAAELTLLLEKARKGRGSVDLDMREVKVLYEDGKIEVPSNERTLAHRMIEQFMVLANESVAELMTEKGVPFVYRIHEAPAERKAEEFLGFLSAAGISADFRPDHVSPQDYRKVLLRAENTPLSSVVSRVMLRSMSRACYSPQNKGHFGLASACYCHFTSPIRRYPDLVVHRIIKDALISPAEAKKAHAAFAAEAASHSSECERNAAEAERDVDALYLVTYMEDKIGTEAAAVISGVTALGLYAELENGIDGFIPLETLPGNMYEYDETRHLLTGTRASFRLGQRVRIRVTGTDFGTRRVLFGLKSMEGRL